MDAETIAAIVTGVVSIIGAIGGIYKLTTTKQFREYLDKKKKMKALEHVYKKNTESFNKTFKGVKDEKIKLAAYKEAQKTTRRALAEIDD